MSVVDTAALRPIAEAATPGPWQYGDGNEGMWPPRPFWEVTNDAYHNPPADEDEPWLAVELHTGIEADAAHIATFDPPTVLALLAELDTLREQLEFSQQTTTNVMTALAESGAETTAAERERDELAATVARIEALAADLDRHVPPRSSSQIDAGIRSATFYDTTAIRAALVSPTPDPTQGDNQ